MGDYDNGVCTGFIGGVDQMLQLEVPRTICVPNASTVGQEVQVALKYLNDHPEKLHLLGATLIRSALFQAWPCYDKAK